MKNKHYNAVELGKVLDMLAEFTDCPDARDAVLSLEPETELNMAQALMNQTSDAHSLMARFGAPSFGGLKNVNNALSRANAGSTLTMRELLDIAETLRSVRSLYEWRSRNAGIESVLDVYFTSIMPNKYLEEKITSAIISEDEMSDSASPQLYDIRRKIRAASSKVREKLDTLTRSTYFQKFLRDSIVTMRNGRYVVPVKAEDRNDVKGLVHDTSSSGATVFIEPAAVVEANNEIKVLQSAERDEIDRILCELSVEAGSFYEQIKASYECGVELNIIFAKAKLAYAMKAGAPILNDYGVIKLRQARHPLIDPKKVVPTDIALGGDFDTLVITGPNTGGKTVSIKTLGLLTLMASCGLMVPAADRSELSVFGNVLADIGDEQSIEQSLSTFSAHMTNIIDIMNTADSNSLVLIDELGAGTDPVEGAALAIAILEDLNLKGAKIAATTHYAELKEYALQTPGVENACCEFDVATLRPTYRLLIGMPGRSNAFAISEKLGLSYDVVLRAKQLVSNESRDFEQVVAKLEESRRKLEDESEQVNKLRAETETLKAKLDKSRLEIEGMRKKEMERATAEASKIVEQARRTAYTLISELEQFRKERDTAADREELIRRARRQVKQSMNDFDDIVNPVESVAVFNDDEPVDPATVKIGDSVVIADIGQAATVCSLPDKKGNLEVQTGFAKSRVNVKRLRRAAKQPKKQKTSVQPVRTGGDKPLTDVGEASRCDLRGMNVEEGILELDRFIDQSIRLGIGEITVIHGKGTGVLRNGIQAHLKNLPAVKSFRVGTFGEGENGVTIVTLK
ncbi:MAG: endonuclease MutS2 [Clostridia bacterium]|nr:endonuclease MutS2 [Clostridia bacterium]